jgi:RNA polymerase sigma factor (sigma-70 family)
MSIRSGKAGLGEMRTLFDSGAMGVWSDGDLLSQFLAGQDGCEPALRVLIRRHGPMVLGICRRILHDETAADDAFQATFLVLVRKAQSLRGNESLTNWIYGVAVRVAKKERSSVARRRSVEQRVASAQPSSPGQELERAELRSVIDEEVGRLPDRYRIPLILCYIEGLRHEEVAQRLGCPVGTVESRLSRGRERLRSRLTRRGLSPTASMLGAVWNPIDLATPLTFTETAERTLNSAIAHARAPVGRMTALGFSSWPRLGIAISTVFLCCSMFVIGLAFLSGGSGPPHSIADVAASAPDAEPQPASSQPSAKTIAPTPTQVNLQGTLVPPPKPLTKATLQPSRASCAYAPELTGITIDGQLEDWPVAIARYPIDKLLVAGLLGSGGLNDANLSTSADLSAAFSVGYDLKEQLIYLAVIVRDDKLVLGHASHLDTDAVEVFIDGRHSDTQLDSPATDEEFKRLELQNLPVQQYVAIPGKGMIYGLRQASNPVLMAGSLKNTKTRMAFTRKGDVSTFEWAIQPFDKYPDQPTRLEPGKRIGFDIAVVDKDVPASSPGGFNEPMADRSAWIFWGPQWRGNKMFDAGSLGELILVP